MGEFDFGNFSTGNDLNKVNENMRWAEISMMTTCPSCGQPVPLCGFSELVTCSYCQSPVKISGKKWKSILDFADYRMEKQEDFSGEIGYAADLVKYTIKPWKADCEHCHKPLAPGHSALSCSCGNKVSLIKPPDWLTEKIGSLKFLSGSEELPGDNLQSESLVVMSCPSCGGSLNIGSENERVTNCSYCSVSVYIPDPIWLRLHPVKTVVPFYAGFSGKSNLQLKLEEKQVLKETKARLREQKRLDKLEALRQQQERKLLEVKITLSKAWRFATGFMILMLIALMGALVHVFAGPLPGFLIFSGALTLLISVIITCYYTTKPISVATRNPGEWTLFVTWFWVPFALLMPMAGQVMALIRTLILIRGKFAASTISSGNSSSSYTAVTLENREGWPAAVMFALLTFIYPLCVWCIVDPAAIRNLF